MGIVMRFLELGVILWGVVTLVLLSHSRLLGLCVLGWSAEIVLSCPFLNMYVLGLTRTRGAVITGIIWYFQVY